MGISVRKMVAVGHLVHKYDEIICSLHRGGHPASHHDPHPSPKLQGVYCLPDDASIIFRICRHPLGILIVGSSPGPGG